jgi:hypothetical protein
MDVRENITDSKVREAIVKMGGRKYNIGDTIYYPDFEMLCAIIGIKDGPYYNRYVIKCLSPAPVDPIDWSVPDIDANTFLVKKKVFKKCLD